MPATRADMIASNTTAIKERTGTAETPDVRTSEAADRSRDDLLADVVGQFQRLQTAGKIYVQTNIDLVQAKARALALKIIALAFVGMGALALFVTGVVYLAAAAVEWIVQA